MPILRVSMFDGRSIDKKRQLVQKLTEVVTTVCEVEPEHVTIVFDEVSRENWASGGTLVGDRKAKT
jgi:4-oxalocrotonate tautomerase